VTNGDAFSNRGPSGKPIGGSIGKCVTASPCVTTAARRSKPSRDREARRRARGRRGEAVYYVAVEKFPVISALIETNRLTESQALHRELVAKAIGGVVRDWAARWRK
jgi:hypothetical protein